MITGTAKDLRTLAAAVRAGSLRSQAEWYVSTKNRLDTAARIEAATGNRKDDAIVDLPYHAAGGRTARTLLSFAGTLALPSVHERRWEDPVDALRELRGVRDHAQGVAKDVRDAYRALYKASHNNRDADMPRLESYNGNDFDGVVLGLQRVLAQAVQLEESVNALLAEAEAKGV